MNATPKATANSNDATKTKAKSRKAKPAVDKTEPLKPIDVQVVNVEGKSVGKITIDPNDFGGSVNKQLLHDVVLMYQANKRLGTARTKTRAEIAGSGRKLFRQKGTGNARVGDRRTAKRVGGGTAFGPKPRSYRFAVPKHARRLASKMALLSKFADGEAVVLDGLSLPSVKTKAMTAVLKKLGLAGSTVLVATAEQDRNVYLSGRNIKGVEVLPSRKLNAYELLRRKRLLITSKAIDAFKTLGDDEAQAEGAKK
jgi:large subunit ribosomal protein L4